MSSMKQQVIPSKWMKDYLKAKHREFTDCEQATLIWNSPGYTWRQKLDTLRVLADETSDIVLKQQVLERIAYEEMAYQFLIVNPDGNYIYVVIEDAHFSCGYFSDFNSAQDYAANYAKEYECKCHIQKQLIFSEKTKDLVIQPWVSDQCIIPIVESDEGYKATENAVVWLSESGEITEIYSRELSDERQKMVDIFRKERFENQFIKIPFGMKKGTPVKILYDGTYGVLADSEEKWNAYMNRIEEKQLSVDFSDIQVVVYRLTDLGYWSHEHINPLYLEPEMPEVIAGDKKSKLLVSATEALSNYFQDESPENSALVIAKAREYAENCSKDSRWSQMVYRATKAKDILW